MLFYDCKYKTTEAKDIKTDMRSIVSKLKYDEGFAFTLRIIIPNSITIRNLVKGPSLLLMAAGSDRSTNDRYASLLAYSVARFLYSSLFPAVCLCEVRLLASKWNNNAFSI